MCIFSNFANSAVNLAELIKVFLFAKESRAEVSEEDLAVVSVIFLLHGLDVWEEQVCVLLTLGFISRIQKSTAAVVELFLSELSFINIVIPERSFVLSIWEASKSSNLLKLIDVRVVYGHLCLKQCFLISQIYFCFSVNHSYDLISLALGQFMLTSSSLNGQLSISQ